MCDYPKDRPQFFAMKFLRQALESRVPQRYGRDVYTLLSIIAIFEDGIRYKRPVCFGNDHLTELLGCESSRSMERIRDKAVESGWLVYSKGSRVQKATYWVQIPETEDTTNDTEQGTIHHTPEQMTTGENVAVRGEFAVSSRGLGGEFAVSSGEPSYLLPKPNPEPIPPIQESQNCCAIPPEEVLTLEKKTEPTGKQKQAKPKKPAYRIEDQVFPEHLDTIEFRAAWVEWDKYKREIDKRPLTQYSADRFMARLRGFTENEAIASIDDAITSQWHGLFPKKNEANSRRQRNGKPDYTRQYIFTPEDELAARNRSVTDFV